MRVTITLETYRESTTPSDLFRALETQLQPIATTYGVDIHISIEQLPIVRTVRPR
jgi:hypothetical protein